MIMTELDKTIREIALNNWEQFVQLMGKEAITNAKVCLLRQKNKSYNEIANKLRITETQSRYACKKCEEKKAC